MKIPKQITIVGRTYKVRYNNTIGTENGQGAYISADKGEIVIQGNCTGNKVEKQAQTIYFLHECVHAFLTAMAQRQLNDDEHFVDQLAEILYQFIPQVEGK